jgi:hypothetical protein
MLFVSNVDEGVEFGIATAIIFLLLFGYEVMRSRREGKNLGREKYTNAATWGIFLFMGVAGHVHKPEDPSILISAGAGMELLAFSLLYLAPRRPGVSGDEPRAPADFGMLMVLALFSRLVVTTGWSGYLPVDATGDGCLQLIETITMYIALRGVFYRHEEGWKWSRVDADTKSRVLFLCTLCFLGGQLVFGDLNRNCGADEAYAMSLYLELAAWSCFLAFAWRAHEGINAMGFLPACVQAMCRGYFWYAAYGEAEVRSPRRLQALFPPVLLGTHVLMVAVCGILSSICIHEFAPELPHRLILDAWKGPALDV